MVPCVSTTKPLPVNAPSGPVTFTCTTDGWTFSTRSGNVCSAAGDAAGAGGPTGGWAIGCGTGVAARGAGVAADTTGMSGRSFLQSRAAAGRFTAARSFRPVRPRPVLASSPPSHLGCGEEQRAGQQNRRQDATSSENPSQRRNPHPPWTAQRNWRNHCRRRRGHGRGLSESQAVAGEAGQGIAPWKKPLHLFGRTHWPSAPLRIGVSGPISPAAAFCRNSPADIGPWTWS